MRINTSKAVLSLFLFSAASALPLLGAGNEGQVNFAMRTGTWFNKYTDAPSSTQQNWLRDHFWRMQSTAPYFDSRLNWYPNAWVYQDLYGVKTDDPIVGQHPDWFLKDSSGHLMFIPFECNGTKCSQYAADPGNAQFRSYWISHASGILKKGYKGLWIDDVNLAFRVSNGAGKQIAPVDPRTGKAMTITAWMKYIADFTKTIRSAFPSTEIVHNSIWYAGGTQRDYNPSVIEEIQAADYIDCERGIGDAGLTGGTGDYSLNALLKFVDHVHALGRNIILLSYGRNGDYQGAGYFLISNGEDAQGDQSATPDNWWAGYDVNLGAAQGARYTWNNLLRRDFSGGMVLLNPPDAPTITVTLPHAYTHLNGSKVTSITLGAKQGAILLSPSSLSSVKIDAGGHGGSGFSSDVYASGGSVASFTAPVDVSASGAAPASIYQSKRTSTGSFTYTVPALESGHTYTVKLHFADDLSTAPHQRMFNITINGTRVLTNFDIFGAAGDKPLKAVVKQFSAKADGNGEITIKFEAAGHGAALVSAVEVLP